MNPLGPLKLLNFKDRVPSSVQKYRIRMCLECEKAELGFCTECLCPLAAKSWVASRTLPPPEMGHLPTTGWSVNRV